MAADTWSKLFVSSIVVPVFLLILGTIFLPRRIEQANKQEAIRIARLKKALDIGDRNRDFASRLNVLKTRMHMFNELNVRERVNSRELRDIKKRFEKEHTDDYLELDRVAWWWYWDMEREGEVFDWLSVPQLEALHSLSEEYGKNVEKSVGVMTPLWQYLSSRKYDLSDASQKEIEQLESEMISQLNGLSNERTKLVKAMAACFAQSRCASSTTISPTLSPSATQ